MSEESIFSDEVVKAGVIPVISGPSPMDNKNVADGCEKFIEPAREDKALYANLHRENSALSEELAQVREGYKTLDALLTQAVLDAKAFIQQVDREGLGMATVTDHRKRVEKFLSTVGTVRGLI